ncbi:MAG: FAD-dependent oxidoreductase, partial [Novosphingobium sp.]
MSKPPRTRSSGKAEKPGNSAPTVAVIGGGLAGINAALQLIKAGFAVTIFEADSILGGNTSSVDVGGIEHDVYPHMFCDWYVNFWHMFENELGLSRDRSFEARPSVMMRQKGRPDYAELFNPTSLAACIHNLRSGAMKPAEMLLLGFSELDLLSFPFQRSGLNQLQQLDVNGFIYSRGYSTEPIAKMENYILSLIWSINSEQTAAATYQNFLRHAWQFPNHAPFAWMLKGSLAQQLIAPAEARLRELGCAIKLDTAVTCLRIENDKPMLTMANSIGGNVVSEKAFDYAVCAIPPQALASLVLAKGGNPACRSMVECEPTLANLQRLDSVAIPVVDLYLNKKLKDFPKESIGLAGS